MSYSCYSPSWFFGWDVGFELLFAIILLTISVFAFRLYKESNQKNIKYFGIGFLFIGISYVLQSIFNFLIIEKLDDGICKILLLKQIAIMDLFAIYSHILLCAVGLIILVYMTIKKENKMLLLLLILISLLSMFMSENILFTFYLISTILLIYLTWYFVDNYLENHSKNAFTIAFSFFFLMISQILFLFSMKSTAFYVAGHVFELIGYSLILINFYKINKNEPKKRPTRNHT